jgi:hypothetical protein
VKKKTTPKKVSKAALRRIEKLRQEIASIDLICSGSLIERMKKCGKPNCRCADDPDARHGPYYEWSRLTDGHMVHKVISAEEAQEVKSAIQNHRKLQTLLLKWKEETMAILFQDKKRKSR